MSGASRTGTVAAASSGTAPRRGIAPAGCDKMPAWLIWVIAAALLSMVELLSLAVAAGLLAVARRSGVGDRGAGGWRGRAGGIGHGERRRRHGGDPR
jgi:hypothetical protein